MCGITGYIGYRDAYPIVINGLKRLEYRGYDSAGLMLFNNNQIALTKTKGKVLDLEGIVDQSPSGKEGKIGIGHTRWATHGVPNDVNSHPHFSQSGKLVIVHNGIIENYDTLKKELTSRGYTFKSDTDTEVLINLIEEVKKQEGCKLGKAVQLALTQVIGAYAIAVFDKSKPNEIIVAKLGSPIAIGIGEALQQQQVQVQQMQPQQLMQQHRPQLQAAMYSNRNLNQIAPRPTQLVPQAITGNIQRQHLPMQSPYALLTKPMPFQPQQFSNQIQIQQMKR